MAYQHKPLRFMKTDLLNSPTDGNIPVQGNYNPPRNNFATGSLSGPDTPAAYGKARPNTGDRRGCCCNDSKQPLLQPTPPPRPINNYPPSPPSVKINNAVNYPRQAPGNPYAANMPPTNYNPNQLPQK
jgi:hypothetical protein